MKDTTTALKYVKGLTPEERVIFVNGMDYANTLQTALQELSDSELKEYSDLIMNIPVSRPVSTTNPVLDEKGKLENFLIRIDGKSWKCKCGCNVFHKPDNTKLNLYQCNSCKTEYDSE